MRQLYYLFLFGMALMLSACTAQQIASSSSVLKSGFGGLRPVTESEAASGIQAALNQGVAKSIAVLHAENGFFGDKVYKLFLPPEVEKVATALTDIGMGSIVEQAVKTINRAAEDAVGTASPIFVNAIKSMTINDALGIVKGGSTSATDFFRNKTTMQLKAAFKPNIQNSLDKTGATKYYGDIVNTYNNIPLVKKVNADLADYVVEKAIYALFDQVAKEEKNIRENPIARGTELLQRVFGGSVK